MIDERRNPWQIVTQLRDWAVATPWCQWLELAGSLGREAGDNRSDVDAGVGVDAAVSFAHYRDQTLGAVLKFSPVTDSLIQTLGTDSSPADHLIIQYADGRQLSLVVSPASARTGLPPGARALFDRTGQLAKPWLPESFTATMIERREWAFLAWWALGDVDKHARRGAVWRALASLDESRNLTWKLHAAAMEVDYPLFGAVSVENAGLTSPRGIEKSLVSRPLTPEILRAADALASTLAGLCSGLDVEGMKTLTLDRLAVAR